MAIGVDTSKWKPRKIIGTPASKFRNILGVCMLSVGLITGVFFHDEKFACFSRSTIRRSYRGGRKKTHDRQWTAKPNRRLNQKIHGRKPKARSTRHIDIMSIDSNSECVRSKYFAGQTDMDESLLDFQEEKKNCKGPKPAQKPVKPKTKKVTKRIKGQKDIRTALKGKKNELVSYSKEFDTVCKKSGLDVDSEQLQLAIALSKSLQTESNNPESSQTLTSQQRVAKIRKTLQEYGFKVPEAKITAGKKTKKHRKQYKLLTVSEQEKHQNITEKYTRILFENLDHSKVEQDSSNNKIESEARIFYIASSIPYECMKDNNIFYVDNLVEKSITNGSLLRDWSEIPGRPESPKVIDTNIMNFKEIDCSQDELDIILSGPIKSVKNIFTSKEIGYKMKYRECDIPKIVIEGEEKIVSELGANVGLAENKSPFQKAFTMESPAKIVLDVRSPVNRLFEDKSLISEEIEIISPIKQAIVKSSSKEVINIETSNKLTFNQQCRSSSPDIFDDELSSIMETTKPLIVLSQEHKTKVFSQDYLDLTQCANFLSQNSDKGIQLSQNVTKRRSNDFMEITDCIVGSLQPIHEDFKEIDLTQSPKDKSAKDGNHSINFDKSSIKLSNDAEQNTTDSISQNITDEQQIIVVLNQPHQHEKENIDLTQNSNEEDKEITIEENIQTPDKKIVESMDLTQSSNSTDIDGLPVVELGNSQSQTSLDDTIIVDKDEYIANGKVRKSFFVNETQSQVFDLTQAQDTSFECNPSPVQVGNTESYRNSFYEDFVHDHSESAENSKEIEQNSDLCKEQNSSYYKSNESQKDIDLTQSSGTSEEILSSQRPSENTENSIEIEQQDTDMSKEQNTSSHNESKESSDDIDLTQGSSTSEEIIMSQRIVSVPENIPNPNNSSLGKKDDLSIDYDEIIIEGNICEKERFKETKNDCSLNHQYDSSRSEVHNDIEIHENNDVDVNLSQNSEVFQISDKELDYSLHQSRRDFPGDNFNLGGISVLDNVTKPGSYRKSLSEGCQPYFTENKNETVEDSFLPEVYVKKAEKRIIETAEFEMIKVKGISPIKIQEVIKINNGIINIKTPKNSEYIIKTVDVTPMADYASMSTPQRNRELDRYGLKPLKRKRAIKILTHLYNQTHPTIQQLVDEDQPSPSKKPRTNSYTQESSPQRLITPRNSPSNTPVKSPRKFVWKKPTHETRLNPSPTKTDELERDSNTFSAPFSERTDASDKDRDVFYATSSKNSDEVENNRNISSAISSNKTEEIKGVTDVCGYEVTSEVAVVRSVDCSPDDWVFQKREKSKVHSCRVPLHIAFHNYVLSRRTLREAILKYEPVNIDVIHKELVGYGHRYDPKDLLKFLDKKCITVKTTDNR